MALGFQGLALLLNARKKNPHRVVRCFTRMLKCCCQKESGNGTDLWGEFARRIANVDTRLRKEKPSKRFTRDEVLAMLDEIDPEGSEKA